MNEGNPFGVRRADSYDLDPLCELVLHLAQEDSLQPVSEEKVRTVVQRCVDRDRAIAGVVDGPQGIEASVGLVLDQLPFSDEDYLAARWLGTSTTYRERIKTHRKRGYRPDDLGLTARLQRFAKWASETMEVPLIISVLTTNDLLFKMDSYSRQMPQTGAMFGWGILPDRVFFDQTALASEPENLRGGGVEKIGGTPSEGEPPRGQVRQSSSSVRTAPVSVSSGVRNPLPIG